MLFDPPKPEAIFYDWGETGLYPTGLGVRRVLLVIPKGAKWPRPVRWFVPL